MTQSPASTNFATYATALAAAVAWGDAYLSEIACCRGMRFLRVPLVGYLRHDLALMALAALTALLVGCGLFYDALQRCCGRRRLRWMGVVLAIAAVPLVAWAADWLSHWELVLRHWDEELLVQHAAMEEVTVLESGMLVAEELARAREVVHDAVQMWVHMTSAKGIMYFNLGVPHIGFESAEEGPEGIDESEAWTLDRGWGPRGRLELELMSSDSDYPDSVTAWQARPEVAWIFERFRELVAERLNVSAEEVVLGGDSGFEDGGRPAFHIYGPSRIWQFLLNPHYDKLYGLKQVGDKACEERVLSFSLPLSTPKGGGLIYWDAAGRHRIERPDGSLLVWSGSAAHSIAPWPYDGRSMRISIQAFGSRCGGRWHLHH